MIASDGIPSGLSGYVEYGYRLGWSFTSLVGKRPILKAWQSLPRESLEEALSWASKGNVGLRTGRVSGIVVVDVDPGADVSDLDLPPTLRVNTGRAGGYHLYYRYAEAVGNSNGKKLGAHIDFKGDGGQVVFPGSAHPDTGKTYEWAEGCAPWEAELADLPSHILERIKGRSHRPPAGPRESVSKRNVAESMDRRTSKAEKSANNHAKPYVRVAQRLELNAIGNACKGTRNATLNKSAFNLGTLIGGGYLDRAEVEEMLCGAGESVGLEPGEVEATIRSGIEAGIKQPRRIEMKPPPASHRQRHEYILTPGVHKDDHDNYTEQSNAMFTNDVLAALPADTIYRKDFIPGEVLGRAGNRKWVELSPDRTRIVVDGHIKLGKWVISRKSKEQVLVYQPCNRDAAGVIIAQARQAPCVRELELIVEYPIYGPGFSRVPAGWRNGLFYDEPAGLRGLEPETDCEVIHNVLCDLVVDFPFKTEADLQNFFGLLLTPIVAPALDGNRPMHLINSPLERTGKTKLVNEVLGGVLIGREAPAMQITDREEEREKRILAMLLQGETLMHLDNLPHYVDSTSLSSLLTAHVFGGRVLGVSRTVKLANYLTLVATGNNVAASGEIAKRIVPIMIEPMSAHPETRREFHHPDLRVYVRSCRRTVLECLLGLVENWRNAGQPRHPNRFGGFENWSEVIGGILRVNGFRAWRGNEADWRRQADPQGAEIQAFVEAWDEAYGLAEVEPKELRDLAEQNELFGYIFAKRSSQAISVAFGRMLSRRIDMPVGSWYIRRSSCGNASKYRLEAIT